MEWFYFSDGVSGWHGRNELARCSKWIMRQRSFRIFDRRFFYGETEVALELIEEWPGGPRL